jgi:SnoaL-like domain
MCLAEDIDAKLTNLLQLTGRESFSAWLSAFHAPYSATQHVFSNFMIAGDGDGAVMRSYVVARLYLEGHPGGSLITSHGYYLDRVVRLTGQSASRMVALARPPPSHIVCRP